LLCFGKYKTHKLLIGKKEFEGLLIKYIEKFWDYIFSVTIITTISRFVVIFFTIYFLKFFFKATDIEHTTVYNYFQQPIIFNSIVIILSVILVVFFCEILPVVIARKKTESVILQFLSLIKYIDLLLSIPRYFLKILAAAILKKVDINFSSQDFLLDDEDIKNLFIAAANQGIFKKSEYEMINNIFSLKKILVKNIMVPQSDVAAVDTALSAGEILKLLTNTGYSRLPVFENSRDNIIGIVYAKELLPALYNCNINAFDIKKFIKKIIIVPESKDIITLLKDFQKEKMHLAAVIDEYGVFSGIITIEDILEEIVGDIKDEFDEEEEMISKIKENEYIVDARIDIEDLNNQLNINLPISENYETLAGFFITLYDDIPQKGAKLEYKDYEFIAETTTKTRLLKVRIIL